jgi:hypothetical protein
LGHLDLDLGNYELRNSEIVSAELESDGVRRFLGHKIPKKIHIQGNNIFPLHIQWIYSTSPLSTSSRLMPSEHMRACLCGTLEIRLWDHHILGNEFLGCVNYVWEITIGKFKENTMKTLRNYLEKHITR